jgi:AraC-like DNA-binding protein
MSIALDYAVPSEALTPYVTLFYWFRADLPLFEDVERADHAQLRFRLTPGATDYRFADGTTQSVAPVHLVGPTTGAFQVRATGPIQAFGAGITPAGWAALTGMDASAMLNRAVNAVDLFGPGIASAVEQLQAATDLPAMQACAEAIVGRLLHAQREETLAFVRKVDAWLSTSASPQVAALVAETGLSRRQVERKCRALYGGPPKLLSRKYRALRAAVALLADDVAIDEIVGRGFYDQSHMIREIKHFTGMTPGQMKAEPTALAQLTIANRYALAEQVHPIISRT